MLKIFKNDNSLIVEGVNNNLYVDNGQNSYPLNSLIVVVDDSDIVTFRSAATNDVLFSGVIENITINGEAVTKDNIIAKFDAVSNVEAGGGSGGGMTDEEREELKNLRSDVENALGDISALEIDKQDKLKSGENIKTVNGESLLGEGNIEIQGGGDDHFQYVEFREDVADKGNGLYIQNKYKVERKGLTLDYPRFASTEEQAQTIQERDYIETINQGSGNIYDGWESQEMNRPIGTYSNGVITFNGEVSYDSMFGNMISMAALFVNGVKVKDYGFMNMNFTLRAGDTFTASGGGGNNDMFTQLILSGTYSGYEFGKLGNFRGQTDAYNLTTNEQLVYKDVNKNTHNVALQDQLKTINNQSIVGTGNITISAEGAVKNINGKTPNTSGRVDLTFSDIDSNRADAYTVNTANNPGPSSSANDVCFYKNKQVDSYIELNMGNDVNALVSAFICVANYDENAWTKFDCNTYAYFYDYSYNMVAQVDGKNIILYESSYIQNDKIYYSEIWEDGVKIKERNSGERVTLKSGKKYVFVNPNNIGSSIFSDIDTSNASNYVSMNEVIMNYLDKKTVRRTYKDAFQYEYNGKSYNILNEGNVKTINGESIYGDGNIEVSGGGASLPAGNYLVKFEQNGGQVDFTQRGFDGKSESIQSIIFKTINGQSLFGMGDIKTSNEWTGTLSQYQALGTYDNNVTYYVVEG